MTEIIEQIRDLSISDEEMESFEPTEKSVTTHKCDNFTVQSSKHEKQRTFSSTVPENSVYTWNQYITFSDVRILNSLEVEQLRKQDARGVLSDFHRNKLELQAHVNWDKFYKRNETRFFKDRHWTTLEFAGLLDPEQNLLPSDEQEMETTAVCSKDNCILTNKILLEVGCGVGNLFYPLLETCANFRVFACDFSPRAIGFVKEHSLYDPNKVTAFVADITKPGSLADNIPPDSLPHVITIVFVLSGISPSAHASAVANLASVSSKGTTVLFRDYAVNDMAMLRFKPGSKICDRFYVRQDGTRSYFFTMEEVSSLFVSFGFRCLQCCYLHRRTTNVKENIDVPRQFVQAKFVYEGVSK